MSDKEAIEAFAQHVQAGHLGVVLARITTVGDYIFTGCWKDRGRIGINRLSDGARGQLSGELKIPGGLIF